MIDLEKLKSAARGAIGLGKMFLGLDYKEEVAAEIAAHRQDICSNCPNNKLGICSVCGCIIALKTKTLYNPKESEAQKRLILTVCPEGKW